MLRLPQIRRRRRSRGQGIVEFALILPILILMLLITLDFGRLFMSYITLTNTTRVAANYGATNPGMFTGTPNTVSYDAIVDRESVGLNCDMQPDGGGFNPPIPTFPTGTGLSGKSVAAMTCDFELLTPFMTGFFGGPLAISAKAEFPIRTGAIANIDGTTTLPPPGSPIADFSFTGVTGGTVNGSGNVTGVGSVTVNIVNNSANGQTWQWEWGDGSADEFVPVPAAHTFTGDTTYTVRLTVTNPVGSSTLTRTVTVTTVVVPPPVAGFYGDPLAVAPRYTEGGGPTGTPIRGSLPLVVDFTNTTTGGTTYSWDFGDGSAPGTGVSPQHTYTDLGVFSVTLTVTAPTGGTPITRTVYVTTGCVVPNFNGTSTAAADATWTGAGFNGTTRFRVSGNNGNGNPNPPSPPKTIVSQSLVGGSFVPATPKNPNGWECAGNILLDYAP